MEKRSDPLLAILISGRGSNMGAILRAIDDGGLRARVAVVISNRGDAPGLARAREAGIETLVMPHGDYPSRDAFDRAIAAELVRREVRIVCLAGFMRRLGPAFFDAFPGTTLNVHPSLLPSFPGVDAQRQALEHGAKVTGVTVHIATPELDGGPIVMQAAVPVEDADTSETLAARILVEEHRIFPAAVQRILDGGWRVEGRRVVFDPAVPAGRATSVVP